MPRPLGSFFAPRAGAPRDAHPAAPLRRPNRQHTKSCLLVLHIARRFKFRTRDVTLRENLVLEQDESTDSHCTNEDETRAIFEAALRPVDPIQLRERLTDALVHGV